MFRIAGSVDYLLGRGKWEVGGGPGPCLAGSRFSEQIQSGSHQVLVLVVGVVAHGIFIQRASDIVLVVCIGDGVVPWRCSRRDGS